MDYADAIRRQAEDAPRRALPVVSAALWRAYGEGHITEAEAEVLSGLIEARRAKYETVSHLPPSVTERENSASADNNQISPQIDQIKPRKAVGSRARSDASLERRRRWAASGRIPPVLAAKFTPSEQAVLSLVAAEVARKGDCRLSIPHLAAVAGVSETSVRNAIREAKKLSLLSVEERRISGNRNDTSILRVVSVSWSAWLRLARKGMPSRRPRSAGGGCKSSNRTPTQDLKTKKRRRTGKPGSQSAPAVEPRNEASRVAGA